MAAHADAKGRPWARFAPPVSRLGRLIIGLNVLALVILIGGALALNEFQRGLVETRMDSLLKQAENQTNLIDLLATHGEPEPSLDLGRATSMIQVLFTAKNQRVRLFSPSGQVLIDSSVLAGTIEQAQLPPARHPGEKPFHWPWQPTRETAEAAHAKVEAALQKEIHLAATTGAPVAELRRGDNGERLISVSAPIQRVQAVLGVLTLEAAGVDQIVAAQRAALLPFILIAIAATIASSLLLNQWVARPIIRLSKAADSVRLSQVRTMSLPDLAERDDEVGDLTRSLEAMTAALSGRLDAIERFAADVSHEIKNPLTSMRSAVETLELAPTPQAQSRLLPILKKDVDRLDRLITDISNASRLDAELSRETPRTFDLGRLLAEIVGLYEATRGPGDVEVQLSAASPTLFVTGRDGPLSQVFRNLIDNARSFSPTGRAVRLTVERIAGRIVTSVEDDGPGVPPENLESVFERFYTQRPKSHAASQAGSGHSGLGLSIARQIVEAHGGSVRAENRTDAAGAVVGARFVVALPEARPRG